jgi:two-component system response regulator DevR
MLTQRIAGVKRTGRDFGPCPLRPRSTKMCSMTGAGRIRIFLVDDHEVVRRGLIDLFDGTGDLEVVGEAGTLASALALVEVLSFDVAVLDVRLPDGSGIELCREIRSGRPAVRCLMLSSFADDEALVDASMAGAHGYISKQIRGDEITHAIRQVANGNSLLDPGAVRRALERVRRQSGRQNAVDLLSPQEQRIFELIGEGMSNRQIADVMYLAEKTVKNYVSNVLMKLGMERRTEAAALAARLDERQKRI